MEINITRADVSKATDYGSLTNCLLATAIKRQMETDDVVCGGTTVDIGEDLWHFEDFDYTDVERLNDLVANSKGSDSQILMTVSLF